MHHAKLTDRDRTLTFGPDDRQADGALSATVAINDPANAGRTIRLEAGMYRIQQRWVLQEGMTVIGAGRDRTIVDGTDVLWSGLDDDYRALIGMGVDNLVQGLTVQNSRLFSMIGNEPGGFGTPPFSATIRDVRVQGPSPAPVDEIESRVYRIRPVAHSPMGVSFNGGDSPGQTSTVAIEDTIVDGILGNARCDDPRYFVLFQNDPADCLWADDGYFSPTRGFGIFLVVANGDGTLHATVRDSQATGSDINLLGDVTGTGYGGRLELDTSDNVLGGGAPGGWGAGLVAGGDLGTGSYPDPTTHDPMPGVSYAHTEWTSNGDRFVGFFPLVLANTLDHFGDEESCTYYALAEDGSIEQLDHAPPCAGSPGHTPHDLLMEWMLPGSGPIRWSRLAATIRDPIFDEEVGLDIFAPHGKGLGVDRCPGDGTDKGAGGCMNTLQADIYDPLRATADGLEPLDHVVMVGNCDPTLPSCHDTDAWGNELSIDVWH